MIINLIDTTRSLHENIEWHNYNIILPWQNRYSFAQFCNEDLATVWNYYRGALSAYWEGLALISLGRTANDRDNAHRENNAICWSIRRNYHRLIASRSLLSDDPIMIARHASPSNLPRDENLKERKKNISREKDWASIDRDVFTSRAVM